ncbi:putative transcriptional regulator [Beijerinckia sp. GAS462]|nr:putative transcriptional regulator [Beijerinckia sp. GAS462]SED11466.1 ROS/MUCR transcriptional regulator protein [Beijerinckia sp. 28-YEA-48]
MELDQDRLLRVAATLIRSYVAGNHVPRAALPALIFKTHASLQRLASPATPSQEARTNLLKRK